MWKLRWCRYRNRLQQKNICEQAKFVSFDIENEINFENENEIFRSD
jgi:hypothetical protein